MATDSGVAPEQQGQIPEQGSKHGKKHKKSRFYKRFAQQELKGWSPVITANAVVIYFFLASVVCLALGIPILLASLHVVEYKARYDNTGPMAGLSSQQQQDLLMQQGGNGLTTSVNITVTKTMNPPVCSCILHHSALQPLASFVCSSARLQALSSTHLISNMRRCTCTMNWTATTRITSAMCAAGTTISLLVRCSKPSQCHLACRERCRTQRRLF